MIVIGCDTLKNQVYGGLWFWIPGMAPYNGYQTIVHGTNNMVIVLSIDYRSITMINSNSELKLGTKQQIWQDKF